MSKQKVTTYLHFYTSRYTPEGGVAQDAYSWYFEKSDGSEMSMSDKRWLTKGEVIADAIEKLGEEFWKDKHIVISEDWLKILTYGIEFEESEVDTSETTLVIEPDSIAEPENYVTTTSELDVELVQHAGNDQMICQAARVSTLGAESLGTDESSGLINFLAKNRHGSPFEHGLMTFRVTAPIFVWREFMRHRIGFSYNEQSGRYMEMDVNCYIPDRTRNLVQVGKPGAYTFEPGSDELYEFAIEQMVLAYDQCWASYHAMLDRGIAKELARVVLPVATYSTAYVTCNPRSLMSFLSLRTIDETSMFPSYPQEEIRRVADKMEDIFASLFPTTHNAFCLGGRVAP
ncbi:thymidylate synthase [Gordonia phage Crocheter]|uniref:ThyX-like thymidylate synthase n=1 Tax=Gordonia phage Crocheter TaxID=2656532 RepID=A0A649VF78_9CAUD|nr:thymidylate synthase [Gordonia phage Crocheter]QGJ90413.1 ThyX-like thymidylate synthase [Gordonia phage Crocheter]